MLFQRLRDIRRISTTNLRKIHYSSRGSALISGILKCTSSLWMASSLVFATLSNPAMAADSPILQNRVEVELQKSDIARNLVIDGQVTESEWLEGAAIQNFLVNNGDPELLTSPSEVTTAYVLYDDVGLYVAATMPQPEHQIVARISEQDASSLQRDFFTIMLDASGDGRYGYFFVLFPGGNHLDGTLQAERNFDHAWDGAWKGRARRTANSWSAEFFIPWSILNLPASDGQRAIGIFLERYLAEIDEKSSWPRVHRSEAKLLSAFNKIKMEGIQARQQLDFYPYISSTGDLLKDENSLKYGVDVFWRPKTNFQLTAAANPDFGTVEADAAILNFSAFETFFPEKRLFFQEGMEVFSVSGYISPLHTRRIGASPIPHDLPNDVDFDYAQFSRPSDLLLTTKATGQFGAIRYGVLGAIEDDTRIFGQRDDEWVATELKGRDFAVLRAIHEKHEDDYQRVGLLSTLMRHTTVQARTNTVDFQHRTDSGRRSIDGMIVHSDVSNEGSGLGGLLNLGVQTSSISSHFLSGAWIDDGLNLNHLGYLSRNDWRDISYLYARNRYFEEGRIKETTMDFNIWGTWNGLGELIGANASIYRFQTTQALNSFWWTVAYTPPTVDDVTAYREVSFRTRGTRSVSFDYRTNPTKKLVYSAWTGITEATLSGHRIWRGLSFNWTPHDQFKVQLSSRYTTNSGWLLYRQNRRFTEFESSQLLLTTGMAYFINAKQHIRFDLHWSSVEAAARSHFTIDHSRPKLIRLFDAPFDSEDDFSVSHVTAQLRYRWEIAPMSDVYLVYNIRASEDHDLVDSFADKLSTSLRNPYAEFLVAKIRYRFGK